MRNLRGALSGDRPASQYGVLAGLRVTLPYGLVAPMNSRPLCPRRRDTVVRFMTTWAGRRPVRHSIRAHTRCRCRCRADQAGNAQGAVERDPTPADLLFGITSTSSESDYRRRTPGGHASPLRRASPCGSGENTSPFRNHDTARATAKPGLSILRPPTSIPTQLRRWSQHSSCRTMGRVRLSNSEFVRKIRVSTTDP